MILYDHPSEAPGAEGTSHQSCQVLGRCLGKVISGLRPERAGAVGQLVTQVKAQLSFPPGRGLGEPIAGCAER